MENKERTINNKLLLNGQKCDETSSVEEEGGAVCLSSGSSIEGITGEAKPGSEDAECIFCS